jgi:Zinc finger, C2H2 type
MRGCLIVKNGVGTTTSQGPVKIQSSFSLVAASPASDPNAATIASSSPKSVVQTHSAGTTLKMTRPYIIKTVSSIPAKKSPAGQSALKVPAEGSSKVIGKLETPKSSTAGTPSRVLMCGSSANVSLALAKPMLPMHSPESSCPPKSTVDLTSNHSLQLGSPNFSSKLKVVGISSDWIPLRVRRPRSLTTTTLPVATSTAEVPKGCATKINAPYSLPDPKDCQKPLFDYKMVKQGEGYVVRKLPLGTLEAQKQASRLAREVVNLQKAQPKPKPVPPPPEKIPVKPHKPPPPIYNCRFCDKNFRKYFYMKEHELTHSLERNYPCTEYPNCMFAGKNQTSLWKHVLQVHKMQELACEICGKVLRGNLALRIHQDKIHFNPKRAPALPCTLCDKTLHNKQTLRDHLAEHENARNFHCADCPKRFNSRKTMANHVIWHMEDRPFPCDLCDSRFKNSTTLRVHRSTHSDEKHFKCTVCGDAFKLRAGLLSHQKHTKHKSLSKRAVTNK